MDDGAIARNVAAAREALRRVAARNGNPNLPPEPPASVTGVDYFPSRAVDVPIRASHDAQLNWGRSGQVETNTSRGDTSRIPEGAGINGSEHLSATPSSDFGRPVIPAANHGRSMNMADIISGNLKTRDGSR